MQGLHHGPKPAVKVRTLWSAGEWLILVALRHP